MTISKLDLRSIFQPSLAHRRIVDPSAQELDQLVTQIKQGLDVGDEHLANLLSCALFELANTTDQVSIAVTGLGWLGAGVLSVEQSLLELINSTRQQLLLCCYAISPSAIPVLKAIFEIAEQGADVRIVCNAISKQHATVQDYLKHCLQTQSKNKFSVFDFKDAGDNSALHAKVAVVDQHTALIGSANLSFHGMVANHEMAVVVSGPTASEIASRIDRLCQSSWVQKL